MVRAVALAGGSFTHGAVSSAVCWRPYCPAMGPHGSSLLQKVLNNMKNGRIPFFLCGKVNTELIYVNNTKL